MKFIEVKNYELPVVLVWMFLMNQGSMSFTENHKCIHWSTNSAQFACRSAA